MHQPTTPAVHMRRLSPQVPLPGVLVEMQLAEVSRGSVVIAEAHHNALCRTADETRRNHNWSAPSTSLFGRFDYLGLVHHTCFVLTTFTPTPTKTYSSSPCRTWGMVGVFVPQD